VLYVIERKDKHQIAVNSETLRRQQVSDELLLHAWKMIPPTRFERSRHLRATLDMGAIVGTASVIKAPEIQPTTTAQFAKHRTARGHDLPCRVLEIGQKPFTRYVTVVADWIEPQKRWLLRNAYYGQYVFPQPWDFSGIARTQRTLKDVLAFWCRAAFCYTTREFESPNRTTWAELIEIAAARSEHPVLLKAGYYDMRHLWRSVTDDDTEEKDEAIQARAAYRAFRNQSHG
jgi:hypothetical protein